MHVRLSLKRRQHLKAPYNFYSPANQSIPSLESSLSKILSAASGLKIFEIISLAVSSKHCFTVVVERLNVCSFQIKKANKNKITHSSFTLIVEFFCLFVLSSI